MSTQLLLFLRAWSVLIRYGQQCGWLAQDQHLTTMLRPTPCQSHFVHSGASSLSRTKGFQMDLFKDRASSVSDHCSTFLFSRTCSFVDVYSFFSIRISKKKLMNLVEYIFKCVCSQHEYRQYIFRFIIWLVVLEVLASLEMIDI